MKKYEYKFVRLEFGFGWFKEPNYKEVVEQHATQGWRLTTILAPSGSASLFGRGRTFWYELVFEREIS